VKQTNSKRGFVIAHRLVVSAVQHICRSLLVGGIWYPGSSSTAPSSCRNDWLVLCICVYFVRIWAHQNENMSQRKSNKTKRKICVHTWQYNETRTPLYRKSLSFRWDHFIL